MATTLKVKIKEQWYTVEVGDMDEFPIQTVVDGELIEIEVDDVPSNSSPQAAAADVPAKRQTHAEPTSTEPANQRAPTAGAVKSFKSPMPGVILSVAVQVGDQVVTGDPICILEAMKMQQTLRADWAGIVQAIHVSSGDQIVDGQTIVDLE
jgi:biotin carboxyl carrier protein